MPSRPASASSMSPSGVPSSAHRAFVAGVDAGDDLAEGRFARAVLAEKRVHLARHDVQRNALERLARPERTSRCHATSTPRRSSAQAVFAARYLACSAPISETIISLTGVGTPSFLPASTIAPLMTSISVRRAGLDVLQHRRLAADCAGEERGNRLPSFVVVERDALGFGDGHDFPKNGRHHRRASS